MIDSSYYLKGGDLMSGISLYDYQLDAVKRMKGGDASWKKFGKIYTIQLTQDIRLARLGLYVLFGIFMGR